MPTDHNPYQAPRCGVADSPKGFSNTGNARRLYLGWLVVFALNLIVPGFLGWQETNTGGRIGMFLAAILLLSLGLWLCYCRRDVGFSLVVGGVAVALSQVFPMLQLMAGIASSVLAEAVGLYSSGDDFHSPAIVGGELGGFVMTLTTGGLLMAAALVAGLALRALRAAFR